MKLSLNRNERVLVGVGLALSLIALSGLIYWFIAYFRLSIAAHYLTIHLAGTEPARTDVMFVVETTVLGAVACNFVSAARHRHRTRAAGKLTSSLTDDKSLPPKCLTPT